MKHVFFPLSVSLSILIACNNHKTTGEITVAREDGKAAVQSEEAIQKVKEEL